MILTTELEDEKMQVLIVDKQRHEFTERLKEELKKYDNDIFSSPTIPTDLRKFDLVFLINEKYWYEIIRSFPRKKFILISTKHNKHNDQIYETLKLQKIENVKIIQFDSHQHIGNEELEKILWFTFSKTDEIILRIHTLHKAVVAKPKNTHKISLFIPKFRFSWTKGKLIASIALVLILMHTAFLFPFLLANSIQYKTLKNISVLKPEDTAKAVAQTQSLVDLGKALYTVARPTFLLFGLVIVPDNYIQLTQTTTQTMSLGLDLQTNALKVSELLFKKDKTPSETATLSLRINQVTKQIEQLEEYLAIIYEKFPTFGMFNAYRQKLGDQITIMKTFTKFLPHAEELLGKNTEKNYLLLFANNMEIRPGGGFIGSFGILRVKNMTIDEIKVYDVYDADGQLKAHIDPPEPIAKYLKQPHWFLRDSAFSPDFVDNFNRAQFFLEREMGFSKFDGGLLITTSAIQNVLGSIGTLYIPDFKENVTAENFYLKAQLYAEQNFFPGSTQKKRFLSAVVTQLLLTLETSPLPKLFPPLKKSFDEKQIVAYINNQEIQEYLDSLYWSGRMITPKCAVENKNCIVDYIFPVEANLGVNKANFFVNKSMGLAVKIDIDGSIENKFSMTIKNDSPNDVFPGGTYQNYQQIILPKNATVRTITKNGTLVEDADIKKDLYQTVGFFIEVKSGTEAKIEVGYSLDDPIPRGEGIYQLIVQKQIGSPSSDLALSFTIPSNISLVNENFSPLVKDNTISYNTNLTADKIFYIDLIRE